MGLWEWHVPRGLFGLKQLITLTSREVRNSLIEIRNFHWSIELADKMIFSSIVSFSVCQCWLLEQLFLSSWEQTLAPQLQTQLWHLCKLGTGMNLEGIVLKLSIWKIVSFIFVGLLLYSLSVLQPLNLSRQESHKHGHGTGKMLPTCMASYTWKKPYNVALQILWVCKNSPFLMILHRDKFSSALSVPPTFYNVLVVGSALQEVNIT